MGTPRKGYEKNGYFYYPILMDGVCFWTKTHKRPHVDETVGIWMLDRYASREFLQRHSDANNIIPIGVDGGSFDEHAYPERGIKRKEGESSATLVEKALRAFGVTLDPAVKNITAFVNKVDGHPISDPDDIASIVKDMHAMPDYDSNEVIEWVSMICEAKLHEDDIMEALLAGKTNQLKKRMSRSVDIMVSQSRAKNIAQVSATTAIAYAVLEAHEAASVYREKLQNNFSLEHIANVIAMQFADEEDIGIQFVEKADNARKHHQYMFREARKEFLNGLHHNDGSVDIRKIKWREKKIEAVTIHSKKESIREQHRSAEYLTVAIVHSDNPLMSKYYRSRTAQKDGVVKCDLLLQRQSSGHAQIFVDYSTCAMRGDKPSGMVDLSRVAKNLHLAELRKKGDKTYYSNEMLVSEGGPEASPWHYFPANGGDGLYNGSLTHDAPPTRLETEKIFTILKENIGIKTPVPSDTDTGDSLSVAS